MKDKIEADKKPSKKKKSEAVVAEWGGYRGMRIL
jgi:hypothetical protein